MFSNRGDNIIIIKLGIYAYIEYRPWSVYEAVLSNLLYYCFTGINWWIEDDAGLREHSSLLNYFHNPENISMFDKYCSFCNLQYKSRFYYFKIICKLNSNLSMFRIGRLVTKMKTFYFLLIENQLKNQKIIIFLISDIMLCLMCIKLNWNVIQYFLLHRVHKKEKN